MLLVSTLPVTPFRRTASAFLFCLCAEMSRRNHCHLLLTSIYPHGPHQVDLRAKLAEARLVSAVSAVSPDPVAVTAAVEAALKFCAEGPKVEAALR